MSTPIVATDGNAIDAATCNKYIAAGGDKVQVKTNYARIRYNGTAWEVHGTTDSSEIVSGDLAWSTDHVNVTLTGYTVIPCALPGARLADTNLWPKAEATSTTQVQVAFYNDAGTRVTVQATTMDTYLFIIGV